MKILLGICLLAMSVGFANAESPQTNNVKARSLQLNIPANWKKVATTSEMRVTQYSIPSKSTNADFVVFYFGGPTGGVKANVDRWVGQFVEKDRTLKMFQGKCAAGSYILVDTEGTWNKPDGPPFAQKKVATPDSRVLNVIVIEKKDGKEDYYFIKLSGNKDVIGTQTAVLRKVIGADMKTEKPFELKDAPN